MTYFIKKRHEHSDRNKLDREIADHMKQYQHMLITSDEMFDHFIKTLKQKVKELNAAYPRIQKKIEVSISTNDGTTYIWISDQLSYDAYKATHIYSPF